MIPIFSLTDLSNFIREADEGMLQPVEEGDYNGLVNVMAYLMNVKERQEATDEMFEPLKETINLLKSYDQDISEEVNVLLQVITLKKKILISIVADAMNIIGELFIFI